MAKKKRIAFFAVLALALAITLPTAAQESAVKGAISGQVLDASGALVPGAKVVLTGPIATRTATSDAEGNFTFSVLIPGSYSIKIEMANFKSAVVSNVEVFTDRTTTVRVTLEPGVITQTVEVTAAAIGVDTTSTAIGANLNDTFYQKLPLARGVANIFYLSPGVASGGGSGTANPSISGGSGLENLYVADGVDITDTAFGGLGVFSRVYGSVATGINLSFIKEVQVKTGGYEPQYGKATGGIVQIVTKSGSREYHGAISAYYQPTQLEENRRNADDFNLVNPFGKLIHSAGADIAGELGGYVPHFRDRLFFFTSMNPSEQQRVLLAPPNDGLFALGNIRTRALTYNYAAKLTYKLSDKHVVEGSVFGDPTHTNAAEWRTMVLGVRGIPNTTNFSKLTYGTRNWVVRYNGILSPSWLANMSFTWGHNFFNEKGFANLQRVRDQTQTSGLPGQQGAFTAVGLGFVEPTEDNAFGANMDTSKTFHFGGEHNFQLGYRLERSFYDGTRGRSGPTLPAPTTNAAGATLPGSSAWAGSIANYDWRLLRASSSCTLCPLMTIPGFSTPQPVLLRMFRSEFGLNSAGVKAFSTDSTYHVAYIQDSWTPSKYVTINGGLRWENERIVGQDTHYSFTGNWSPRVGVIVDPKGDRKTKIFANFGRYSYALPLDLAERSLTNELDLFAFRLAPDFTVNGSGQRVVNLNQFGTVTPVIDPAHVLNGVCTSPSGTCVGGVRALPFASTESVEPIFPGTKMTYEDEWVVGAEHEFPHGIVVSAKYIRRDLKRTVEDTGGISPEAANAGITQQFAITNVRKNTDIFTNPVQIDFTPQFDSFNNISNVPAPCGTYTPPGPLGVPPSSNTGLDFFLFPVTNSLGSPVTDAQGNTAACFAEIIASATPVGADGVTTAGSPVPDGIPDGFTDPVRIYWGVEFEVNKQFSHNWQLRANWRIARLVGNFEGAFRNDNGQTDPGISSLFDFTTGNFNLLGDQFLPGVLNTDRLHIVNGYFSYVFDRGPLKNLTLGTGVRIQSGTPISQFAAHPVYENAGEVPLGGRGKEGRTPVTGTVDFHAEYLTRITEKGQLHFGVDLFNLADSRRPVLINQNIDLGLGVANLDFLKPTTGAANTGTSSLGDGFISPFAARVFFRFTF